MHDSWHLLFPLLSSVLFVIGALFAKDATVRGITASTTTAATNWSLTICWGAIGIAHSHLLPVAGWGPAFLIAFAFVGGQLCTFLAFQLGDVSVATPVFGVKIIQVAIISSILSERPVEWRIWIAAILATVGIAVIQTGSGPGQSSRNTRRALFAITFALAAATCYSLFDIGVQHYGRVYGAVPLLSAMFVMTGIISLGLIPWMNAPRDVVRRGAALQLTVAGMLMALQAVSISYALGQFGDATRVNIVYSLRGLWSVMLAWLMNRWAVSPEPPHSSRTLAIRLAGAILLTLAVVAALA